MSSLLSKLVCGLVPAPTQSEIGEVISHVASSIDLMVEQLSWLGEQDDRRMSVLGPFVARSLLELSATALIGRLDPFRLLILREIQLQKSYDTGVKRSAAVQWQGDVLAEKADDMWSPKKTYPSMTKALLGDYYDHVLWRPAVTKLLDADLGGKGGHWMEEVLRIPPEGFVNNYKALISRLYSSASKGIHHEFVLPPDKFYDRATMRSILRDVLKATSVLGFASNFIPHIAFPLSLETGLAAFDGIQSLEVK